MRRIGIIADTHGLLRPGAVAALAGCGVILHAGDVGKADVLAGLRAVAPVTAIRGNVDRGAWADALPETARLLFGGTTVYMLHDRAALDFVPPPDAGWVVVSGHSHQPSIAEAGGVLFINPGSAGPRRFRLPVTVAIMEIEDGHAQVRLVELAV